MKNRESLYPGRIKLTAVDEANGIYDLIRADQPQDEGTPLNKKLLDFAVAACGVTAGTSTAYTLDDEFGGFELVDGAKVNFRLHVASGAGATLNVNGTGAKAIKNVYGDSMASGIPANVWMTATYSESAGAFVLMGQSVSASQIASWNAKSWDLISKSPISSAVSSVDINFPDGYDVYRLKMLGNAATFGTIAAYTLQGYGLNGGATAITSSGALSRTRITSANTLLENFSSGYFDIEAYVSWYRNKLEMTMHSEGNDNGYIASYDFNGTVLRGASYITTLRISGNINPPTTIILEGLK